MEPQTVGTAPDEQKQTRDFLLQTLIRKCHNLTKELKINEDYFNSARYAVLGNHRDYYLYGCLRQVHKACIHLLSSREFVDEQIDPSLRTDDTAQLITESLSDTQKMWSRKLHEVLIDLINFSNTNEDNYYALYLNAEILNLWLNRQKDNEDFFGFTNFNIDESIKTHTERVKYYLDNIEKDKNWIINDRQFTSGQLPIFKSYRFRYTNALQSMTPNELLMVGVSYANYSLDSIQIHGSIKSTPIDITFGHTQSDFMRIAFLGLHIITRVNGLLGKPEDPECNWDNYLKQGSEAPQILKQRYAKPFNIGDIVFAHNDLAEIIEIIEYKNHRSFKIRYLSTPPIPDILEDYFNSEYVVRILDKSRSKEFYLNQLKRMREKGENVSMMEEIVPIFEGLTDEDAYLLQKKTYIDFDKMGILKKMFLK